MFKFDREQRVFEIAGVDIGRQSGEFPTVLIDGNFYEGHRIVKDSRRDVFNREQAVHISGWV